MQFPKLMNGLFATKPSIQDELYESNGRYLNGVTEEFEWMQSVSLSINQGVADSWSKHHAAKNRRVGKQAILPLIDAPVHTSQTQT